jgi:hypothetical protein
MLDKNKNKDLERKNSGQCRFNVTLFGDVAFNKYLESIKACSTELWRLFYRIRWEAPFRASRIAQRLGRLQ